MSFSVDKARVDIGQHWWIVATIAALLVATEVTLFRIYPNAEWHLPIIAATITFVVVMYFSPATFYRRKVQYCLSSATVLGGVPGIAAYLNITDVGTTNVIVDSSPAIAVVFLVIAGLFAYLDHARPHPEEAPSQINRDEDERKELDPNLPPPSAALLPRPKYESAVGSIFNDTTNIRVVVGDSGTGKTEIVSGVFRIAADSFSRWIDCRQFYEFPKDAERASLVVFENITIDHPLISEEWLPRNSSSNIIAITQSDDVALRLLSQLACADKSKCMIKVERFTQRETKNFLDSAVGSDIEYDAVKAHSVTEGLPLFLQLVRGILLVDRSSEELEKLCELTSTEERLNNIVDIWTYKCLPSNRPRQVLRALCEIPFLGMSQAALREILEFSPDSLDAALPYLTRYGLVREICDNTMDCTPILAAHERVRQLRHWHDSNHEVESKWRERYYDELIRQLSDTSGSDLLTCVDAWIVGWMRLFDTNRPPPDEVHDPFEEHRRLLVRLFRSGQGWENAVQSIHNFLQGRIDNAEKQHCAIVIGLAHMIQKLDASRLLAMTIWRGSLNPDCWARASSIYAAVEHWRRLGEAGKKEGLKELQMWEEYAFQQAENLRIHEQTSEQWCGQLDLDFCAVIGGYLRVANINECMRLVESERFQRRFACTTLSHLVLTVRLADDGVLDESGGRIGEQFRERVRGWWSSVGKAELVTRASASTVASYLHAVKRFDFLPKCEIAVGDNGGTAALDVAVQAQSDGFQDYVLEKESRPTSRI